MTRLRCNPGRRRPSAQRVTAIPTRTRVLACAVAMLSTVIAVHSARATLAPTVQDDASNGYLRLSPALDPERRTTPLPLSGKDLSSFSGIGMIVCTAGETRRTSTAFLVGAFDVAVTVAHLFENESGIEPQCVYNSTDALGQIRERIEVANIKSQWTSEPGSFGRPETDLAVVRLAQPSRYAQRTLPLGRFSGYADSVVMVGFKQAAFSDTFKLKKRGRVLNADLGLTTGVGAFAHDMGSQQIAAGAPVIDESSGIIIGIHTLIESSAAKRATMITMNDWLEATIRSELHRASQASTRTEAPTHDPG